MTKKNFITILILLILNVGIATSVTFEPVTTSNSQPLIIVQYEEPVSIINVAIIRSDEQEFKVIYTTEDNELFHLRPESHLANGDYQLIITSEDYFKNAETTIQPFTIEAPPMNITLIQPTRGVSATNIFDLVIETERESEECRYSLGEINPTDNFALPNKFEKLTDKTFIVKNVNDKDSRIKLNFNSQDTISGTNRGKQTTIYVKCKDNDGLIHPKTITLAYDDTPSKIDMTISPNPIIDSRNPRATLTVDTDDRTICKYKENGVLKEFEPTNPYNVSDYKRQHATTLEFLELAARTVPLLYQPEEFRYEINCTNIAGLTSPVKTENLTISFQEEFTITIKKPDKYNKKQNITLIVETSIQTSNCFYGLEFPDKEFEENIRGLEYRHKLGTLNDGKYKYQIMCIANKNEQIQHEFIVDTKPPENINITIDEDYCSLNMLETTVKAEDKVSGIKLINYTLSKGNEIILEGITTNEKIEEKIKLEDEEQYVLNIIVFDKAGNYKEASKTFTARNSNSIICDSTNPKTNIETTTTSQGVIIKVVCEDEESGCNQYYEYGLTKEDEECSYKDIGLLGETIIITEKQKICWEVKDLANNIANGSEIIDYKPAQEVYPPTCFNQQKDDFETDIDCGGVCEPCPIGSECLKNNDCITKSCNPTTGKCEIASCENNYLDGDETDIDCGGTCDPCIIGLRCEKDSDCETNTCEENECVEFIDKTIDSDNDEMPDYWEDKHGLDKYDPTDARKDNDGDGYTNIEEYKAKTDPNDPTSKPKESAEETGYEDYYETMPGERETSPDGGKTLPIILIITGAILVFIGAGYLIIKNKKQSPVYYRSTQEKEPIKLIKEKINKPATTSRQESETKRELKTESPEEIFKKNMNEKNVQRSKLFDEFEKEKEDTKTYKELVSEEKTSPSHKKTSLEEENGEEDKREVKETISELRKEKEGKIDEVKEEDIFQELELMSKDFGIEKEEESSTLKDEKIADKEKTSEEKKEGLIKANYKDEKEPEEEKLSLDEAFKKLAEITGQEIKDGEGKKDKQAEEKEKSKDLIKVFANAKEQKQLDTNIFKAIISQLLNKNQITKQTVAEILFEFLDEELLTKKEVMELMKELGIHER